MSIEPEHGNARSPDRNSYIGVASHEDADWIELLLDGKDFQLLNREPVKLRAMLGVTVYEEQARLQPRFQLVEHQPVFLLRRQGGMFGEFGEIPRSRASMVMRCWPS